jgi:hypothetical protein
VGQDGPVGLLLFGAAQEALQRLLFCVMPVPRVPLSLVLVEEVLGLRLLTWQPKLTWTCQNLVSLQEQMHYLHLPYVLQRDQTQVMEVVQMQALMMIGDQIQARHLVLEEEEG